MFKKFASFFINKTDKNGKKKSSSFENLIVIVIIGVVILLAGSYLTKPGSKDAMNSAGDISTEDNALALQQNPFDGQQVIADIEKRMSELLSKVEGAGSVSVMIYADSSSEQVPAYNDQQDTKNDERTDGKTSEISEKKELALSGDDLPVILKVIVPQIKGVVVVAEGANDMLIKAQLNNAVCTLLGIPEHRVQILKHK